MQTLVTQRATRVLVADDRAILAQLLVQILTLHQFEAIAVQSGHEAVAIVGTFRPDVVLLDVVLGDMDGVQVAEAIRFQLANCRIILFSGMAGADHAEQDGHGFEVLAKPIEPQALIAALGPSLINFNHRYQA